ncbi:hypothetical protein, partial [Mesorhizobium sp. M1A.F.Ca.IN.022.05.2.1]|uniref:hypothetical protein n=1 Tax=Mesorhizobium sp. M1A.F.Ca.IN.022.05.2.1 TaxID=2496760 RepID=UPI0019CF9F22
IGCRKVVSGWCEPAGERRRRGSIADGSARRRRMFPIAEWLDMRTGFVRPSRGGVRHLAIPLSARGAFP